MTKPHVVILGAGPAGLGASYQLARRSAFQVTLLEQNSWVGGNAGSFELSGLHVDYGSHRLHPSCDPEVLHDIRSLLGEDLLDRPRHGRIRLRDRWIHFPLEPLNLVSRLPLGFSLGVAGDMMRKVARTADNSHDDQTFSAVMQRDLGHTICHDFYFPYARKIWGLEPEELSAIQAQRRVRNNSLVKMMRKVFGALPGFKITGSGRFFYPRHGFGQISEAFCKAALEAGAQIYLNAKVKAVEINPSGQQHRIIFEKDLLQHIIEADNVWSTIPITTLVRMLEPAPPPALLQATTQIDYRSMILVYLVLGESRFSEYDAHYFPELSIRITRLSEPKNYSSLADPADRTVLCAELPCSIGDPEWQMGDQELGHLICESLELAGIPVNAPLLDVSVRRLRYAYPIYRMGYELHFDRLDDWINQIDGLLTFGRQGLFAHDNTHHALYMAYSAVKCLDVEGMFDRQRWEAFRRVFQTHVVED